VSAEKDGLKPFPLRLLAAVEELLREHDDGLLWRFYILRKALVGHEEALLRSVSSLTLCNRGQVLHVDQTAHHIVVEHVSYLDLNQLQVALGVRVRVDHFEGLLELFGHRIIRADLASLIVMLLLIVAVLFAL